MTGLKNAKWKRWPPAARESALSAFKDFNWKGWSPARRETVLHLLDTVARKEDPATVCLGVLGLAGQGELWQPAFLETAPGVMSATGGVNGGAFARRGVVLGDENLRPRGRRVVEGATPTPVRTGVGRSPVPALRMG